MDLLAPVSLKERIALGRNALLGCLDPTRHNMPYWSIPAAAGDGVGAFHHAGAWDHCHDVARALHGLDLAAAATGQPVPTAVWRDLAEHQLALFGEDDLPGCADDRSGQRFVHLHNLREAAHALAALVRHGDWSARTRAQRMVRRLLDAVDVEGRIDLGRLPAHVSEYTWQPHQEGRAVDALVRLFRATGDEAALDLAARIARFALDHCFGPAGQLREEAGSHGHSITALVAGILDLAALTLDAELGQRARAVYTVGLPRFNATFGWSQESLQKADLRGEANNTGDLVRAALLVGQSGWATGYEDAERYLRSHLLPSQVVAVDDLPDGGEADDARSRRASRLRGGFGFPTPNDLLAADGASLVVYDITSGAVDGLCEAARAAITADAGGVRVNLLFTGEGHGVRVTSDLPRRGRVAVRRGGGPPVHVRVPSWARKEARWSCAGRELPAPNYGGYALAPAGAGEEAVLVFPVRRERTVESLCYERFRIDWMGDQIEGMVPAGKRRPIYA